MAVLKHKTSKNARYTDVLNYYKYRHSEDPNTGHYEPILDEFGLMQERANYAVSYITAQGIEAEPELWAVACERTNLIFQKNKSFRDRKNHEYIISHPESDRLKMTTDDLLEEGKAFARDNLKGYDVLIAVHRDTDNDHIHITINSVRSVARDEESWMERSTDGTPLPCETKAGGKHRNNPAFLEHCQNWLLDYTRQHGLEEKDNNAIAAQRKAERQQSEQQKPKNQQERNHLRLKDTLLAAAKKSHSLDELANILYREYDVQLVRRGETISLKPLSKQKAVRLRTLGISQEDLYALMGGHAVVPDKDAAILGQDGGQSAEQKQYRTWLKERRIKNAERAESTITQAEQIIHTELRDHYKKEDFADLFGLLRQLTYLERDLNTEADKLDRLLGRWEQYQDDTLPEQERLSHGSYLKWCGCDPDSAVEHDCLLKERESLELEILHAAATREALLGAKESWKVSNAESKVQRNLDWTTRREAQLKEQLKTIRANRKKLSVIAYNCQKAADRRIYNKEYLAKAEKFRAMWHEKRLAEQQVKQKLQEIQKQKREAEKAAKRNPNRTQEWER